ncbi:hypothetical protein [Pantoea sp.]|uniref:hypothetical protein n=1 Tax=Pantoea TaxID=53335 RepID=UPI0028ADAB93|nr:hypothetical protein [Pantoea sp.]
MVDQPELNFTANYHIDTVSDKPYSSRMLLEIRKQSQPTDAFEAINIGHEVTFVSSSGEAQRMVLVSDTDDELVFSSVA